MLGRRPNYHPPTLRGLVLCWPWSQMGHRMWKRFCDLIKSYILHCLHPSYLVEVKLGLENICARLFDYRKKVPHSTSFGRPYTVYYYLTLKYAITFLNWQKAVHYLSQHKHTNANTKCFNLFAAVVSIRRSCFTGHNNLEWGILQFHLTLKCTLTLPWACQSEEMLKFHSPIGQKDQIWPLIVLAIWISCQMFNFFYRLFFTHVGGMNEACNVGSSTRILCILLHHYAVQS